MFQRLFLVTALAALTVVTVSCSEPAEQAPAPQIQELPKIAVPENVVDLTWAFGEDTIYWPTDTRGFELETLAAGPTEQGYYYSANRFSSAEHGGTHLDAPIHFFEGRSTADSIPVGRLVGYGIVVDVSEKAHQDPDYQVGVEDFEYWESLHGPMPDGVIILLRTGYGRFWPDRSRYLGTDLRGPEAIPELHFPGLHPDAAEWLKTERNVDAIGIDTPSIDHGQSTSFGSHVNLFEGDIPAFENVANLEVVPDKDFIVVALPMKIAGGSGGPLRIIAMW